MIRSSVPSTVSNGSFVGIAMFALVMLTNHTLLRLRNLPFARALSRRKFRPLFTGNDPKNPHRWVRFGKRTHRFLSHISCIKHVFTVPYNNFFTKKRWVRFAETHVLRTRSFAMPPVAAAGLSPSL